VLVVWLIGVAAAVGTTLAYRRRLLALLLLGAVGLAVSLASSTCRRRTSR